jgi:hypothetical protein
MFDVKDTPQAKMVTINNILSKLAGYASVLLLANYLLPGLYPSLWPLFASVVVLAGIGAIADLVVVPRLGNIVSLIVGAEAMVLILYSVPQLWPGGHMTMPRAIALTLCIAPLEYALHQYVLRWLFPDRL